MTKLEEAKELLRNSFYDSTQKDQFFKAGRKNEKFSNQTYTG